MKNDRYAGRLIVTFAAILFFMIVAVFSIKY